MYITYNIMTANMVMLYAYPSFVHVSFMLISGGDLPDPPRRLVRERWDRTDPVDAKVGSHEHIRQIQREILPAMKGVMIFQ